MAIHQALALTRLEDRQYLLALKHWETVTTKKCFDQWKLERSLSRQREDFALQAWAVRSMHAAIQR